MRDAITIDHPPSVVHDRILAQLGRVEDADANLRDTPANRAAFDELARAGLRYQGEALGPGAFKVRRGYVVSTRGDTSLAVFRYDVTVTPNGTGSRVEVATRGHGGALGIVVVALALLVGAAIASAAGASGPLTGGLAIAGVFAGYCAGFAYQVAHAYLRAERDFLASRLAAPGAPAAGSDSFSPSPMRAVLLFTLVYFVGGVFFASCAAQLSRGALRSAPAAHPSSAHPH